MDIMQQFPCLVINPFTVYRHGFLCNDTTVGQAADLMTTQTVGRRLMSIFAGSVGSTRGILCEFISVFFVSSQKVNLI